MCIFEEERSRQRDTGAEAPRWICTVYVMSTGIQFSMDVQRKRFNLEVTSMK